MQTIREKFPVGQFFSIKHPISVAFSLLICHTRIYYNNFINHPIVYIILYYIIYYVNIMYILCIYYVILICTHIRVLVSKLKIYIK